MRKLSKLVSLMLSVVLCIGMAAPAFAIEYDIGTGRVYVENNDGNVVSWQENHATHGSKETASDDKEIVITGTYTEEGKNPTGNRVTVGENVTDTTITLRNVTIDASKNLNWDINGEAAFSVGKDSNVTVELEGNNTLQSGNFRAGLELRDGASVTVDGAGTLTATGGRNGAGIGSGSFYGGGNGSSSSRAGDITISDSVKVTATGGHNAAGIGSGAGGTAGNITISGSANVTAEGGDQSAGIGSGASSSKAGNITISDSANVAATGGWGGAGIGSGSSNYNANYAGNITISITDGGSVTAMGGEYGAGIGSGYCAATRTEARNITISTDDSSSVTATGRNGAADIGSGTRGGRVGNITICCTANVTATNNYIGGCFGDHKLINPGGDHNYQTVTKPATCTEKGVTTYTCSKCNHTYTEEIELADHTEVIDKRVEPTCTKTGLTEGKHCSVCKDVLVKQETIDALGHTRGEAVRENEVSAQIGVEGSYDEVVYCTVCNAEISRKSVTVPALEAPQPETPDPGDFTPDATTTLADQDVPLAGLTPLYMLLEELRKYEEIPETELLEDFKWLDHAYAQAIYWGLQEELVVDTEEEPLDPDEVLTVGRMREVLVNFVERYLGLDNFVVTLAGEDDEIVMDLGERLTAFYAELDAALKAQEDKAA